MLRASISAFLARDGAAAGLREGRELGVRTGFEVAEEVAFYHGCTQVQVTFSAADHLLWVVALAHPVTLWRYCSCSSNL